MKPGPLILKGKIIDGTGNSNRWMPELLPNLYPGTLNILLENYRPDIEWHTDITVNTIKNNNETNTVIRLGNCLINNFPVFIVKTPIFKYIKRKNWIEIAHTERLRELLNLKNNDEVTITFIQGSLPIKLSNSFQIS